MKKVQAEKANRAQIELHIIRQKKLQERMIHDNDEPTAIDLIVTAMFVLAVLAAWAMGWM